MKIRTRLLIPLLVALAGLAMTVGMLNRHAEPAYQGRKLSQWLVDCGCVIDGVWVPTTGGDLHDSAFSAINQIGTNAVPFLSDLLIKTNSRLQLQATEWANKVAKAAGYKSEIKFCRYGDYERPWMALLGIQALGRKATPFVPALTTFIKRETAAYKAWGSADGTTDLACVTLFKLDPDSDIFNSPETKIRTLSYMLEFDHDAANRQLAAEGLGSFGTNAQSVRFMIKWALKDQAPQVRLAAASALLAIDPEAAAKAGIK